MEVIVGEEEGTSLPEIQLEDCDVNKTIVPVVCAASYGRTLAFLPKYIKYAFNQPLSNYIFYPNATMCWLIQ